MMKAKPDSSDSLVFECDFEEPPEKVWCALTEPALLEAWLSTDVLPVTDSGVDSAERNAGPVPQRARPGAGTEHSAACNEHGTRRAGSSECELLTGEPYRFLRYRWRDWESGGGESARREVHSVLTVELAPCPTGGTHLRLTHGEFRLVSVAPVMTATRIVPIMSARRRRTRIVSFAARAYLRQAA